MIPPLPEVDPRALNALQHGRAGRFAVELLEEVWGDPGAGPRIEAAFRKARWMGSKTRRMVRELTYTVVRRQDLLGDGPVEVRWGRLVQWLRGEWAPSLPDDPWERLARVGSVPVWLLREVGDLSRATRFVAGLHGRAGVTVRVDADARDALAVRWGGEPTRWSPRGIRFERVDVRTLSGAEVQDEGSQLVAELVLPTPGSTVIDWCAGAGGKSLAVLAAHPGVRVLAADVRPRALEEARRRAARAGLPLEVMDHADLPRAARVLVDAPCTSTGTLRRDPALRWRLTPDWLAERVRLQASILDAAAEHVEVGGRLIHATCSALHVENRGVVEGFLSRNADFRALPLGDVLGEGAEALGGDVLDLETAVHGTDAFFGAVVHRIR
ncbi:MAG: RsmB/NOP family class I SAM-dependent RNA methyltransferase [Proteobacteria bacterium]|nr:RsmB/NOP family class I SAM-dependent RNA methyltransferase [Pseudomonadota bacterium]